MENITMWAEENRLANSASENFKGSSAVTPETRISQSDIAKIKNDFVTEIKNDAKNNPLRLMTEGFRVDHSLQTNLLKIFCKFEKIIIIIKNENSIANRFNF